MPLKLARTVLVLLAAASLLWVGLADSARNKLAYPGLGETHSYDSIVQSQKPSVPSDQLVPEGEIRDFVRSQQTKQP